MIAFDEAVPVTTVVTQRARPGHAAEFEAWLHRIAADAAGFAGHLGVNVIRPSPGDRDYNLIFRFRSPPELRAWLESSARAERLREAAPHCEGPPVVAELHGVEAWLTLERRGSVRSPPRYKMAAITFIAVFPLLLVVQCLLAPALEPLPPWARMAVITAATILLVTYLVLPKLTRALASWLYRGVE